MDAPEVAAAAGAGEFAAGVAVRLVPDLDADGTLFGFAVRVPASGDGAITSTSGKTVWAIAVGGAIHNPAAIIEPVTVKCPPLDATKRYRTLIRLTPIPPAVLVFAGWVGDTINVRIEAA